MNDSNGRNKGGKKMVRETGMADLLERARRQMAEITGLKAESVTRVVKANGGWRVGLEMLEMSRIPNATDVLGDYEVVLGGDGAIREFVRKRTRLRGEPVESEAE